MEQIAVEDGGGAAAAGAAGVHLASRGRTAGGRSRCSCPQLYAVAADELRSAGVAQIAQVAGDDEIVVPRRCGGVAEQGGQSIVGGGAMAAPMLARIRDALDPRCGRGWCG